MASRLEISDEEWGVIHPILKAQPRVRLGNEAKCRAFLVAVLWVLRGGAQWRLMPGSLGNWNSVFKRFSRWCEHGVWEAVHKGCVHLPDLQTVFIDSTVIRAHACAAGAAHSCADDEALGNPLDFILTGGQESDIGQAEALLELTPEGAAALGADKGYDSDKFVAAIQARGMEAVIPPRANRIEPRACDWLVYRERHLIECFFGRIKHYRRIFSRFEKLARNYRGFLRFVSALIWLR